MDMVNAELNVFARHYGVIQVFVDIVGHPSLLSSCVVHCV